MKKWFEKLNLSKKLNMETIKKACQKQHVMPLMLCVLLLFASTWTLNYADDAEDARIAEEQRLTEEEKQRQAEAAYEEAKAAEEARQAELARQQEEAYREAEEAARIRREELARQTEEAYAEAQKRAQAAPQSPEGGTVSQGVAEGEEYEGGEAGLPTASGDKRWTINEDGSTTFHLGGKTVPFNVDEYIASVDEIELFYQCVQSEAGNQSSLGKRLVADVILNRVACPKYPNTLKEVILQSGAFEVVTRGYIFTSVPMESTVKCVDMELESQVDYGVMYFRTGYFFKEFGIPYEQVGAHFFSKMAPDDLDGNVDVPVDLGSEEEPVAKKNRSRTKDSIM